MHTAGTTAARVTMTIAEASSFLRIRSSLVEAAVGRGELPVIRRNGVRFVDRMMLLKLLSRPVQNQQPR